MKIIQNPEFSLPEDLYLCYTNVNGEQGQPEHLLKFAADKASLDGKLLRIMKKASGKPYGMIKDRKIGVGVSHTGKKICCGMYIHGEIGLDMEAKNRKVTEGLRKRIIHKKETEIVSDIDTIRLWTIKEAVLKFTGTGLRTAMKKVEICDAKNIYFKAKIDKMELRVTSFELDNYWISVACLS